jgi:hypothetical protein
MAAWRFEPAEEGRLFGASPVVDIGKRSLAPHKLHVTRSTPRTSVGPSAGPATLTCVRNWGPAL